MHNPKLLAFLLVVTSSLAFADVDRRVVNNGNLVLEDIPEIPADVVDDLNRFQNIRSAAFRGWSRDGQSLYVTTRFDDVSSLHRVDMPMGARRQLTFFDEPMGQVTRQPGSDRLLYTQDAGGSEFAQIFSLDPATGDYQMLTDGESRNGGMTFDRRGTRVAFQSTRRNGASNDVWVMDPAEPGKAEVALEANDGFYWAPVEFSASGSKLLVVHYKNITESNAWLVDLDTNESVLLAGDNGSVNLPAAFDDDRDGFWLVTDQGDEFQRLAWQPLEPGAAAQIVTGDIAWNVSGGTLSEDRSRMAFVTNEGGRSRLYLMNPETREYRRVDTIPTGLLGNIAFSPDGRRLGMTVNTAQTPSDTYVLELADDPLSYGELVRWTESEVGGLDTTQFVSHELVHYDSFDGREIPAWIQRPRGDGPHPVVIRIHGGPESQARPGFSSTFQMWVDKLGVAVIQPNVRGSSNYGKSYVKLDNGFKREDSVRDIGALLDWIETQPDLDASRVAVYGGSYGGYMVLASAVHYSDRLRAVIDVVGISNFVTFLENTQDYRRDARREEYGDERDPAMRAHLEKISPVNSVDKMNVPMFIIQGENDPRVPVTEAIQMVEALRERGEDVWYMNALNEGHGYRKRENRDVMAQAIVMFLREHLVD
ncbi:MAG: prolyl oligopeptidase family serine peptidase [Pseudomonadota bacterium]